MLEDDPLIASLLAAVSATPGDIPLRLHVAGLLLSKGMPARALQHVSVVLGLDPNQGEALTLLRLATQALSGKPPDPEPASGLPVPDGVFDWASAEQEVAGIIEPAFVGEGDTRPTGDLADDVERPALTLADVGGMELVKARLNNAFLIPMRNPKLSSLYRKSLRGGLLLYGPPGCGKTYIARALAGELGAAFYGISLSDVLDMYIGQSERNLHAIFDTARRNHPCVLFFDEIDALGQRRSHLRHNSAMRGTVNQFLSELDDVAAGNEGVFVLGATNHPWDVDTALRRPGRLDRTVLVLPPDAPARRAILRHHLQDRPLAGVDVGALAKATEGYSGADLAHVAETAAERAMADSIRTGEVRPITMADLTAALREVRPSTGPWFDVARNVAVYANEGGTYDDLLAYMKAKKLL